MSKLTFHARYSKVVTVKVSVGGIGVLERYAEVACPHVVERRCRSMIDLT